MKKQTATKLIREGEYAAEVDVELERGDDAWAPYLTVEEAAKLDRVRAALQKGDVHEAARYGRVFKLMPVTK